MSLLEDLVWREMTAPERAASLQRPPASRNPEVGKTVRAIVEDVRTNGDAALLKYTNQFDCPALTTLTLDPAESREAASVDDSIKRSLREAARRIRLFHEAQRPHVVRVESSPGILCEKRYLPIEKVGLYVPGGSAPLPSTLLMLAVPALAAGCQEIVLTTPPNTEGRVHPAILAAAEMLGISKIFKCGGAQAIAALAYGTETVPKVDKIFGPGNIWVTEAKIQVSLDPRGAAIDLPAGPSEVLVVADGSACARFVACDLLSQAEHDSASQVLLVSTSGSLIAEVQNELERQLAALPRRQIARAALRSSRAILAGDLDEAMAIANLYAPEHLILQVENAREAAGKVRHAGSVFIGAWTPESVGDYASGTNHVLPTYGFARAFSGLGLESFLKAISFQELSPAGLREIGPTVECLADAEGLEAHRRAVSFRLAALEGRA